MKMVFLIHSYLMYRPLLSITTWHLLLPKWINVLHSSTDIFSHSPFKLVHSSSTFLGFFSLALSFSNFQTFSSRIHVLALSRPLHYSNIFHRKKCLNRLRCVTQRVILREYSWLINSIAQSAGAVEYTNCFSAEGVRHLQRVFWIEVPAMLELWGMRSTPLLPSLLGPFWPGVVAPDKGPIYGLNRTKPCFFHCTDVCIQTAYLC